MRIRIFFHKTEHMRFTGHLDLHKTWERTFRRARLPLAYSQGFHPQPRLSLACALPLGLTSSAEVLDAWLESELPTETIQMQMEAALPPGIYLSGLEIITGPVPALQTLVRSAEYQITLLESMANLDARLEKLLSAEDIPAERRGKIYNLRPLIEDLQRLADTAEGLPCLQALLAARESATGRPDALLTALNLDPLAARVHRTRLLFAPHLPSV